MNLAPGSKINNGAVVLKAERIEDNMTLVLAAWKAITEFVTWMVDEDGNAFWGHYHRDVLEAAENFKNRFERYKRGI